MELQFIQSKIYTLRGQRVMLDFDLANFYGVETKRMKEAVRRNIERFPEDFVFELTREEYNALRTQIASLETGRGKYSKYAPFAFTEHGVAMLSGILRSPKAVEINKPSSAPSFPCAIMHSVSQNWQKKCWRTTKNWPISTKYWTGWEKKTKPVMTRTKPCKAGRQRPTNGQSERGLVSEKTLKRPEFG